MLAQTLNRLSGEPDDWRVLSPRRHMELGVQAVEHALANGYGGDHLAEGAARLLLALKRRQHLLWHQRPVIAGGVIR